MAGLCVDDAFVQQAVRDAETADALPLLAFALRELYDRASDGHYLSLAAYNALGDAEAKLTPLEDSVRKAADDVLAETKPGDEELTALREAFVPAMVRVNDQGEYVRRPARRHESLFIEVSSAAGAAGDGAALDCEPTGRRPDGGGRS